MIPGDPTLDGAMRVLRNEMIKWLFGHIYRLFSVQLIFIGKIILSIIMSCVVFFGGRFLSRDFTFPETVFEYTMKDTRYVLFKEYLIKKTKKEKPDQITKKGENNDKDKPNGVDIQKVNNSFWMLWNFYSINWAMLFLSFVMTYYNDNIKWLIYPIIIKIIFCFMHAFSIGNLVCSVHTTTERQSYEPILFFISIFIHLFMIPSITYIFKYMLKP